MVKELKISIITLVFVLLSSFMITGYAIENEFTLITDYNSLMSAISKAEPGDVLLVGDVDFSPTSPDTANSFMCITVDKSITLKSGKKEGSALFTNGGFLLSGSKVAGEKMSVCFENIVFDGKADYENLKSADFDYPWSESQQKYTYNAPMKAQQALSFKGNVDAGFFGCVFKNYMHEYGTVIDIRYGDYTDNSYMLDLFGDSSGCSVNLNFKDSVIENNSTKFDGGAIYIESNKNVTFTADNCVFSGNRSGIGEFCRGGGFIYASGATLDFKNCKFEKNKANYIYEGMTMPETDTNKGGALLLESSKLNMVNCMVKENIASIGGAISLTNSKADIDGCTFDSNRAEEYATNPYGTKGPWSNMAQGGAVYAEGMSGDTISFINCNIKNNSAKTAYGGIYGYYTPHEDPSFGTYYIKMALCTYENNTTDNTYDYSESEIFPWASHPGDMFENPHLTLFGCYIVDKTCSDDFVHNDMPIKDNGYNYISANENSDVLEFIIPSEDAKKELGTRYGEKLSAVHIGSNYDESLYKDKEEETEAHTEMSTDTNAVTEEIKSGKNKNNFVIWIIVVVGVAPLASAVVFVVLKHKTLRRENAENIVAVTEKKQIVMTRYEDSEIERFISLVPETQLLTARELEVLYEILRGKKQGEVAHYLGIEVSTVKDFYKKIYTKLDVPNKDGLFAKASEVLKK